MAPGYRAGDPAAGQAPEHERPLPCRCLVPGASTQLHSQRPTKARLQPASGRVPAKGAGVGGWGRGSGPGPGLRGQPAWAGPEPDDSPLSRPQSCSPTPSHALLPCAPPPGPLHPPTLLLLLLPAHLICIPGWGTELAPPPRGPRSRETPAAVARGQHVLSPGAPGAPRLLPPGLHASPNSLLGRLRLGKVWPGSRRRRGGAEAGARSSGGGKLRRRGEARWSRGVAWACWGGPGRAEGALGGPTGRA